MTEETNTDWWTGRCKGNTGLFPSTYASRMTEMEEALSRPSPVPCAQHTPAPPPMQPSFPRGPSPMPPPPQMNYAPPPMQPTYLPPPGPPPMGPPMYAHPPPPGPPPPPVEQKPSGGMGSSLGNTVSRERTVYHGINLTWGSWLTLLLEVLDLEQVRPTLCINMPFANSICR